MREDRIPSSHLEGKFKVIGVLPGEVIWKTEKVDLRTISLEKAEEIAAQGFPYLEKVVAPARKSFQKEKSAEGEESATL
jgi:hypothetical protein